MRQRARGRLAWLRRGIATGGVTLALLHSSPDAAAQNVRPVGPEFQVNTTTAERQQKPGVAMDADGDFVVIWESFGQDGDGWGVFGQRYAADGAPLGNEFQVNTYTTSSQSEAAVAMDADGDFVVAWRSNGQEDTYNGRYGIYAQRYDAQGVPQGSEFRVNTFSTGSQTDVAIAMDADGDFVIAWTSVAQIGRDQEVYAQLYRSDGVARAGEFRVNDFSTGRQQDPSVGMDDDGNFVVAWTDERLNNLYGFGDDIFAKRYDKFGAGINGDFRVNTNREGPQRDSRVGVSGDGSFVIMWEVVDVDVVPEIRSLFGKLYGRDGVSVDGEFQIPTSTMVFGNNVSVAMDEDGDFVSAWNSYVPLGGDYEVAGRRFDALGNAKGSEFPINTEKASTQRTPTIGMDSDGDCVIAWASREQDGDGYGIFARRYSADVFGYDAQTLVDLSTVDGARVPIWPDTSPNRLDATAAARASRQPRFLAQVAELKGQPALAFDGRKTGLAIGKDTQLLGLPQPEKSLALVFRTTTDVTNRQVLVELGGAEAGMNAYIDDGRLYAGAWSQAGLPSDWGPAFFNVPIQPRATYVLVLNHRRDAAGTPGRFEAYLNGEEFGRLQVTPNALASVQDNAGVGYIVNTTRFHDGPSLPGERAHAKVSMGLLSQRNEWLSPEQRATKTAALADRFGVGIASEDGLAETEALPDEAGMVAVYPNPATDRATLRYRVETAGAVRVRVYDALGRQVSSTNVTRRDVGEHEHELDAGGLPSGVYLVRLDAADYVETIPWTVVR
ncbi:MAG: T9SS type A sorting domain-containing protein [Bacteroidota bacterium]